MSTGLKRFFKYSTAALYTFLVPSGIILNSWSAVRSKCTFSWYSWCACDQPAKCARSSKASSHFSNPSSSASRFSPENLARDGRPSRVKLNALLREDDEARNCAQSRWFTLIARTRDNAQNRAWPRREIAQVVMRAFPPMETLRASFAQLSSRGSEQNSWNSGLVLSQASTHFAHCHCAVWTSSTSYTVGKWVPPIFGNS